MLAAITRPMASTSTGCSACPSTSHPASAAIAGPRLISTAKVVVGSRRSASSSRVYGSTEASRASPVPSPSTAGCHSRPPEPTSPIGRVTSAATASARASPSALGNRPPTRAEQTMYAAQSAPAASASAAPTGSSRSNPPWPSRAAPASASPAQDQAASRRAVTTDSASGPSTSRVTAGPSGIRSIAW
ncbi:hypothetical protein B0E53_03746 [Micromonospora sp. MH33]|nr:hypothetical protein B0E53_03746 [Micromonospora sp. MH33]